MSSWSGFWEKDGRCWQDTDLQRWPWMRVCHLTWQKVPLQMPLRILRWGNYPGWFGWAQCNHRVFIRARQKGQPERDLNMIRCWLWRGKKGPWAKEYEEPVEAEKGKKMDSSLETWKKCNPWQLEFHPVEPILHFWPPEPQDNKLVLL